MDINASIIDQRLVSIANHIGQNAAEELRIRDESRLKSLTFVYLCVQTILDLESDDAFDCLTEGGGDFGVDAMHISEEYDGEFTVSLFQTKYKNNLEGSSNFPEESIESLINAIQYLFDPAARLQHINERLLAKVEEARSLIRDGYIPQVRALACNNGLKLPIRTSNLLNNLLNATVKLISMPQRRISTRRFTIFTGNKRFPCNSYLQPFDVAI